MTTTTKLNYNRLAEAIALGELDNNLADISKLIEIRFTQVRRQRTIADYVIGATVVFNDYCGTKYLRGHRAIVTSRGRTKITVELERPVGRFVRVENGVAKSVAIRVPPSIVDLVAS